MLTNRCSKGAIPSTIGGGGLEDRDFFQWIERLVMDAVGKAIEMDAVTPD